MYTPSSSWVPNAGLATEYALSDRYKVTAEYKIRWLDHSITNSPLVLRKTQNSLMLSISRSY